MLKSTIKNKMTFFEWLLAIIASVLLTALVINIGYIAMRKNERFSQLHSFLQIIIAIVIGSVILYFILKFAGNFHQPPSVD